MEEREKVDAIDNSNSSDGYNLNNIGRISRLFSNDRFLNFVYFMPVLFIIFIVPLITRAKIIILPPEQADYWKGGTFHVDFFCYYKSTAFIIATCIEIAVFGILVIMKRISIKNQIRYYIPMLGYSIFTALSTLMSANKNVAILGFIEMYQGMSVLLCYIMITFIVMNIVSDERDLRKIFYTFSILSIVIGILGISQFVGHDFLQSEIGKKLILPDMLRNVDLKFSFGKYSIYATMYNTNFVGSYGALVLPVMVGGFLSTNDRKTTFFYYLSSLLSYSTWLGCNSRAGYIGILFSSVAGVIIFRNVIIKKYKRFIILGISFIIIILLMNLKSEGKLAGQFSRLDPVSEVKKMQQANERQNLRFEEISIKDNKFTIRTTRESLIGMFRRGELTFEDENKNMLETYEDSDGSITLKDEKYKDYIFKRSNSSDLITATIYKRTLNLYIMKDGSLRVVSFNNKLVVPSAALHVDLLDGRETFASNRGYIWSRSIPMIIDTIIVGYGPDNYCMRFPQYDYVGRFNTGIGMSNVVVDKPHNMYIQTAINTGLISLLFLVIMWIIYIIDSIKLYYDGKITSYSEVMGACVFIGIIAYMVAGIFNDNIISVAPLYWIMLGAGFAANTMNKLTK